MVIPLNLGSDSYDITLERGALKKASEIFPTNAAFLPQIISA